MVYGDFCKAFFYNLAAEGMDNITVEDRGSKFVITATVEPYDSTTIGNIIASADSAVKEVTTIECHSKTEIKEGTKLIITIENV